LRELGDAFHQLRDICAEEFGDLFGGGVGVLDSVVQKPCRNRCGI
jgi:hypothetical protein